MDVCDYAADSGWISKDQKGGERKSNGLGNNAEIEYIHSPVGHAREVSPEKEKNSMHSATEKWSAFTRLREFRPTRR